MKLIKHPQQIKLSEYFQKIESIAEVEGIDVDDLLLDTGTDNLFSSDLSKNKLQLYRNMNSDAEE